VTRRHPGEFAIAELDLLEPSRTIGPSDRLLIEIAPPDDRAGDMRLRGAIINVENSDPGCLRVLVVLTDISVTEQETLTTVLAHHSP
jgi:hypothetical protein